MIKTVKQRKLKNRYNKPALETVEKYVNVIIPTALYKLKEDAEGETGYDTDYLEELIHYCRILWEEARDIRDL